MNKHLITLVAMSILTVSCGKMDEAHRKGTIGVRVSASETKSEVITTHGLEVLGGFVLSAYVDDEYYDYSVNPSRKEGDAGVYLQPSDNNTANVHFHTGQWTIDNNKNWVADVNTRFYCHAPAEMTHAAGGTGGVRSNIVHRWNSADHEDETSFSYAMPQAGQFNPISGDLIDAENCTDLLFAYADRYYDGHEDYVDMFFRHALSRITFCVSPDDGSFDKTLSIKSIALKSIPKSGNCVFAGKSGSFTWSGLGEAADYAQSYNASFKSLPAGWSKGTFTRDSENYTIYTANNSFFCIPHSLSGAQMSIVFIDNGEEITRTVTLPADTWEAGKYYKYKIAATVLGRTIKVDVTLDEWINYDDKLII